MQQLIIKLSPEATAKYLKHVYHKNKAEMDNDIECSGHALDISLTLIPGITMANISINGQVITEVDDENATELELISENQN